jgi:hypothetical protein
MQGTIMPVQLGQGTIMPLCVGTRVQRTIINCLFVTIGSSNLDNYVVDMSKIREFWHTIKVFYLTRVASLYLTSGLPDYMSIS